MYIIYTKQKVKASRMMAIGPIASLTSQSIELIIRELASIAQIHAPAYATAGTIVRGCSVNRGEVIFNVFA